MSIDILVLLSIVAAFAYFIKGAIGFGPSLIIVALLSHTLGGKAAVIIAGTLSVIGSLFLLWWTRSEPIAHNWWISALLMAFGSWVGTELMRILKPDLFQWLIGIGLIVYSGYRLFTSSVVAASTQKGMPVLGPLGAGVADGLLSTGGTLLIVSLAPRMTPTELRRTLPLILFVPALVRSAAYVYHDMMTTDLLLSILTATPFVISGAWLGFKFSARANPVLLQKVIWGLVLVSGIILL